MLNLKFKIMKKFMSIREMNALKEMEMKKITGGETEGGNLTKALAAAAERATWSSFITGEATGPANGPWDNAGDDD